MRCSFHNNRTAPTCQNWKDFDLIHINILHFHLLAESQNFFRHIFLDVIIGSCPVNLQSTHVGPRLTLLQKMGIQNKYLFPVTFQH